LIDEREKLSKNGDLNPEQREAGWDYENPKIESHVFDMMLDLQGAYSPAAADPMPKRWRVATDEVEWNYHSYMPIYTMIYEDHVEFDLLKRQVRTKADYILEEYESPRLKSFSLPVQEAARYTECFELDGAEWRFDLQDTALRLVPGLSADPEERVFVPGLVLGTAENMEQLMEQSEKRSALVENPVTAVLDEIVFWAEREFAEKHLSPECLAYAYKKEENGYYWCVPDGSFYPAFYELKIGKEAEIYMSHSDKLFGQMKEIWEVAWSIRSYYDDVLNEKA